MKLKNRFIVVFVLSIACVCFLAGFNEVWQLPWRISRASVTVSDANLAAAAHTYSSVSSAYGGTSALIKLDRAYSNIEFTFRFSVDDANVVYELYALRSGGDAEYVGAGTAYAGTQEATSTIAGATSYYADKITVSKDLWPTGILSSCEDDTGTDEMAKVVVNTCGRLQWLVLLTAITDGQKIAVDFCGW